MAGAADEEVVGLSVVEATGAAVEAMVVVVRLVMGESDKTLDVVELGAAAGFTFRISVSVRGFRTVDEGMGSGIGGTGTLRVDEADSLLSEQ